MDNIIRIIADFAERDGVRCQSLRRAAQYLLTSIAGWTDIQAVTNRVPSASEREALLEGVVRLFVASRLAW